MKFLRLLSFAFLFLLVTGLVIKASTFADCIAQIESLKTQSQTISISGKNADKDRASLIRQLDDVTQELNKNKYCDAIKKLDDFKIKVNQLVSAGRITGGQDLLTGADSAISCIRDQAAQTGTTCPGS